jgi:hypothetical protein
VLYCTITYLKNNLTLQGEIYDVAAIDVAAAVDWYTTKENIYSYRIRKQM